MIITYAGDNDFQVNLELTKLKAKLGLDKNEFGVVSLSGSEATIDQVNAELSSYSLFSDVRLVILKEPSKIKGFDELIEKSGSEIPATTTLVIIEHSLDKRKSYSKYLSSNTDFKQLAKLSRDTLSKWLHEYAKERGGEISLIDAGYLIDRVGDNQLLLSQEINKLILYSNKVNRQSIELLTMPSPSSTIFELLDSAFSSNTARALHLYSDQRAQKVEPEQILAMLSWQLNVLATCVVSKNRSDKEVLSVSGLSPYTLSKSRRIADKLSFASLKKLVRDLSDLDVVSKSSKLDLDEGIKNFIIGL